MTTKFDAFVKAYTKLCDKHGVEICPSGYDSLQVWPITPTWRSEFEDCTQPAPEITVTTHMHNLIDDACNLMRQGRLAKSDLRDLLLKETGVEWPRVADLKGDDVVALRTKILALVGPK